MGRVTAGRAAQAARHPATPTAAPGPGDGWGSAFLFALAAGLGLLALYLPHPILGGRHLPIGPDIPVYAWWTSLAEHAGLGAIPGRPGVPGATLALGSLLGTEPLETLALLGPALAAATGLAGAALLEAALGPGSPLRWAGALLVGSFAGYLAAGWLGNLAFATAFLACLAVLAPPAGRRHAEREHRPLRARRPILAAGLLLAAGGLAHAAFLALGIVILLGVAALSLPRAVVDVRGGRSPLDTEAGRVGAAAVAGAAGAAVAFASLPGRPFRVETSQDALLARVGLGDVLRGWFRERLLVDARRAAIPAAAAGLLAWMGLRGPAPGTARGTAPGRSREGLRYLLTVCASWGALTLAALAVLLLTPVGRANRLLPFAFFLPILGAIGLARVVARRGAASRSGAAALLAAGAVVAAGLYQWYDRPTFVEPDELRAAAVAARSIEHLPPGTPLVFVVDTGELAGGFHVVRFANVIRMGLPPERLPDLRVAVAEPGDYLAGRPTLRGDLEHDRISEATVAETAPLRDSGAVLVVEPFNEPGFDEARRIGEPVGPGVVSLRGGRAVPPGALPRGEVGLGPLALVLLSAAALVLLGALGGGWARWALPFAPPTAVAAAAPSVGVAVALAGAFLADRLGLGPGAPWGGVALAVLGAGGYLLAARGAAGASGDRSGSPEAPGAPAT